MLNLRSELLRQVPSRLPRLEYAPCHLKTCEVALIGVTGLTSNMLNRSCIWMRLSKDKLCGGFESKSHSPAPASRALNITRTENSKVAIEVNMTNKSSVQLRVEYESE